MKECNISQAANEIELYCVRSAFFHVPAMNMSQKFFSKVAESQMFRSRSENRLAWTALCVLCVRVYTHVCVGGVVVGLGVCSFTFLHACLYSLLALPCPLQGGDIVGAIDLCSCNWSLVWKPLGWNSCIRFKYGLFGESRSGQLACDIPVCVLD